MRPGHFCPGKCVFASVVCYGVTSFNEAGAFLPRKITLEEPAPIHERALQ